MWTSGIVSVLLNHTRTRGPSVTRMQDFLELKRYFLVETELYVARYMLAFDMFLSPFWVHL